LKITLSVWDIGGQERFDFFKTDFFKGTAAVGIVFDLTRPNTYEKIDDYIKDLREETENVPIVLVGNKCDLIPTIGKVIPRDDVIQKVNRNNLIEYIETSALNNINVDQLFKLLALTALLDLRPRLGEIVDSDHFRFKILLIGDASVGKSSLIKKFIGLDIETSYKITIGLDLLAKSIEILDEDLTKETYDIIKTAILKDKKRLRLIRKLDKISKIIAEETGSSEADIKETIDDRDLMKIYKMKKKKKLIYLFAICMAILVGSLLLIWFIS
jgi:small GTP-binding protein